MGRSRLFSLLALIISIFAGSSASADLVLQLKSDTSVTTNANGYVTEWTDQAAAGGLTNALPPMAGQEPLLSPVALPNGKQWPAIQFNGTNALQIADFNLDALPVGFTLFVVGQANGSEQTLVGRRHVTPDDRHWDLWNQATERYTFAEGPQGFTYSGGPQTGFAIYTAREVRAGAPGSGPAGGEVFINTTGVSVSQGTGQSLAHFPEQGLGIGSNLTQPYRQLKGRIVEIRIYDSPLTETERLAVEAELFGSYFALAPQPPELVLQLKAGSGVVTDANDWVTRWFDQALGDGQTDATPPEVGDEPLLTTVTLPSGVNASALHFNGANELKVSGLNLDSFPQGFTLFVVGKANGSEQTLVGRRHVTPDDRHWDLWNQATERYTFAEGPQGFAYSGGPQTGFAIYTAREVRAGAPGSGPAGGEVFINTTGVSVSQGTGQSLAHFPEQGLGIGSNLTQPYRQLNGEILEIRLYNAPLDEATRVAIDAELYNTYFAPPPPAPTPDLVLQLRADLGATTDGAGHITQWADQATTDGATNAAPIGAGGEPALATVTLPSGVTSPSIQFNGASELEVPGLSLDSFPRGFTLFVVGKANGNEQTLVGRRHLAPPSDRHWDLWNTGTERYSDSDGPLGFAYSGGGQTGFAIYTAREIRAGVPGSGLSGGQVFINTSGTSVLQGTGRSLAHFPELGLGIGSNLTQPYRQLDGQILEVQLFNGPLDDAQRLLVEQQLYQRYFVAPTVNEELGGLIDTVSRLDIPESLETALTTKIESALSSYESNQTQAATNKLTAFINQVEAKRGKNLTDEEADNLIASAQAIIARMNQ